MLHDTFSDFSIRKARKYDIAAITDTSAQLGYPELEAVISRRFVPIRRDRDHQVFVAVSSSAPGPSGYTAGRGTVIGWIHVFSDKLLTSGPRAEVGGLVVDENFRSRGVGSALVGRAEQWAQSRGLFQMAVHTNVVRKRAHKFYEKNGYSLFKQSKVYLKDFN